MEKHEEIDLTIRQARPEDAEAVSEILVEAFPALYKTAFGILPDAKMVEILTALFHASHLALEKTRICEREGCVVGLAILHTGGSIGRGRAWDYGRLLRRHLDHAEAVRAFLGGLGANRALDRRIPQGKDLLYIEALAVRASARGQGIGTLLLADAFRRAKADGRRRVALHVLFTNTRARALYERVGFRLWEPNGRRRLQNRFASLSSWSALLMQRTLDDPQAFSKGE